MRANLRSCREKVGLTLEGVAKKVGVSRSAVGHWETGEKTPSYKNIEKLIELFGAQDIRWLLEETKEG